MIRCCGRTPAAALACAWDTGRAATLQQPIQTLTYYGRATAASATNEIYLEVTGSDATSHKIFSNNQYSANNTTLPIAYPLNALTAATYNAVYNRSRRSPTVGAVATARVDARRQLRQADRRSAIAASIAARANIRPTPRRSAPRSASRARSFAGWDYRAGASYARSEASSVLGTGYYYRGVFASDAAAVASGTAQRGRAGRSARTDRAGRQRARHRRPVQQRHPQPVLADADAAGARRRSTAVSAKGVKLYSGKYETRQFDASVSGELFKLPGGMVQVALGVDYRRESYGFNGSSGRRQHARPTSSTSRSTTSTR